MPGSPLGSGALAATTEEATHAATYLRPPQGMTMRNRETGALLLIALALSGALPAQAAKLDEPAIKSDYRRAVTRLNIALEGPLPHRARDR